MLVEQSLQFACAKIEAVTGADNTDAQRTQGELPPLRDFFRVVEYDTPTIDESHASASHDSRSLAMDDHRCVLIDTEPHHFTIRGDRNEQSIETAALGEVRVDQRTEAEQAEARTDVLIDELSFVVDLVAGESELGKRSSARAGSADDSSTLVVIPDRTADSGSGESRDQLYLIASSEEHRARALDRRGDRRVISIFAVFDDREDHLACLRPCEITLPPVGGGARITRCGGDADDRTTFDSVRVLDESPKCWTTRGRRASDQDQRPLSAAGMPVGACACVGGGDVYAIAIVSAARAHQRRVTGWLWRLRMLP
jgi:hypothetical protein